MWIAVSREQIAQRARALLAPAYGPILDQFTFSSTKFSILNLVLPLEYQLITSCPRHVFLIERPPYNFAIQICSAYSMSLPKKRVKIQQKV